MNVGRLLKKLNGMCRLEDVVLRAGFTMDPSFLIRQRSSGLTVLTVVGKVYTHDDLPNIYEIQIRQASWP